MWVYHGIVWVALVGQQWVAAAAGRNSGHGSDGCATVLAGRRQRNTHMEVLLRQKGGGGCAAVLAGRQRGIGGSEG